jgi:hypothetical protein
LPTFGPTFHRLDAIFPATSPLPKPQNPQAAAAGSAAQ